MTDPVTPGPPPPTPPPSGPRDNKQAMWSLILGILGIVCCGLLAPIAWYMGKKELAAIEAGASSRENEGMAKAGMILGIIGSVLLIFGILWIVFAGGLGMMGAMMEGMNP